MGDYFSERSIDAPLPWLSPERTAWVAAETPRVMAWRRFMDLAHSGSAEVGEGAARRGFVSHPKVQ
jgi:hypothetical protein